MRKHIFIAGSVPLIVGLACGSSGSTAGEAASSDVATYRSLALHLQSALAVYGAVAAPAPAAQACRDAHDRYEAKVRPWVTQMVDMSKGMDAFMETHGGETVTDFQCVAATMMDELDHHRAAACTSADAAANRVEVNRHVGAMAIYDAHVQDRCVSMMGDSTTVMKWSPVLQGCQNWDG